MTKTPAGAPTPKASAKPVKVLSKELRAMIDPEVRKVHAARLQVADMQAKLDAVLELAHPPWAEGKLIYLPDTGGFYKAGTRVAKADDPTSAPIRGKKR
jgi:hypothetical protein